MASLSELKVQLTLTLEEMDTVVALLIVKFDQTMQRVYAIWEETRRRRGESL